MKKLLYTFALSGLCLLGAGSLQWVQAGKGGVVPGHYLPKPDTALVSYRVARVYDLNFKDHQFTADLILSIVVTKKVNCDFEHELQVYNAKKFDSKQISCIDSGDKRTVLLSVRAIIFTEFCVKSFPFDGQHISIKLYDAASEANKLVFRLNERIVPPRRGDSSLEDGWSIHWIYDTAYCRDPDISSDKKHLFSSVSLLVDMHRDEAFQLFAKAFTGMLVAALIAFASLYIDIRETEAIVALGVGGILGAVGNKYIIEGLLPQSSQFCLPDWLHTITIVFILLVILTSVVSMRMRPGTQKASGLPARVFSRLEGILPMIILGAYFLANFICIRWAVLHEVKIDAHIP